MTPIKWLKNFFSRGVTTANVGAPWFGLGAAGADDGRALEAFRSWVFAAVHLNASAVATIPLRMYAGTQGRRLLYRHTPLNHRSKSLNWAGPHVVQKIADWGNNWAMLTEPHPALALLHKPSSDSNGHELLYTLACHLELTGNAYLYCPARADGLPGAERLIALSPDQVRVELDETRSHAIGYRFIGAMGEQTQLALSEIVHIRRPNPSGSCYGIGKAHAAWPAIQLSRAHTQMDLALLENQARPDYAAVVKSGATPTQLERFEAQVQSKLRGPANAGRFLTITGDVQLLPLSFAPKDLAGRKETIEEIAAVFGVPISLLKANDPNKASAETGRRAWREQTILPLCRLIEESLNAHYLPKFGSEVAHSAALAFDNPVPDDRKFELERRTRLVAAGILTRQEAREEEGLKG